MVKRFLLPLLLVTLVPSVKAAAKIAAVSPEGCFAPSGGGLPGIELGRTLASAEKEFLSQSGFTQSSCPPVNVILREDAGRSTTPPRLSVDTLEGGLPRVTMELGSTASANATQLLATSLLLREYYGDHAPVPGSRVPQYPDWVTRGMAFLCFPTKDPVHVPAPYLKGGNPPTLEDFLLQRAPERESPSLGDLYDSMAALLLKAGLSTAAGRQAFREWIGHYDPDRQEYLPPRWVSGWEMRPVERRWLLLIAGNPSRDDGVAKFRSVADSLKSYDTAMAETLAGGATIYSASKARGAAYTMGTLSSRLNALRLQANPLVVPLLDQTIALIAATRKLSEKKCAVEEQRLAELRRAITKQSKEIEDYLNWYEAAKLPVKSGQFERLLQNNTEASSRKGPVGRHLDAVEARGW
jgi:hypothetical protein